MCSLLHTGQLRDCKVRSMLHHPLPPAFKQFHQLLAGLVQLGVLSGRTVVLPDVPCNSW